jgi:hypothetical protein
MLVALGRSRLALLRDLGDFVGKIAAAALVAHATAEMEIEENQSC